MSNEQRRATAFKPSVRSRQLSRVVITRAYLATRKKYKKKTRKEKKNERRRNQYARIRRYKITSTLGLLVWGPVVQWLVQRFRSERLRVRSRRSATFTPSAHVRRQSLPVWPPTLNNYLYLYLYLYAVTLKTKVFGDYNHARLEVSWITSTRGLLLRGYTGTKLSGLVRYIR